MQHLWRKYCKVLQSFANMIKHLAKVRNAMQYFGEFSKYHNNFQVVATVLQSLIDHVYCALQPRPKCFRHIAALAQNFQHSFHCFISLLGSRRHGSPSRTTTAAPFKPSYTLTPHMLRIGSFKQGDGHAHAPDYAPIAAGVPRGSLFILVILFHSCSVHKLAI